MNQIQESQRIVTLNTNDTRYVPTRSQSVSLDNRSRSHGVMKRFQTRKQETELGNLTSPSIPGKQTLVYLFKNFLT